MGEEHFPFPDGAHGSPAMVVISSPTSGGSTRARILFQALLASARKSIAICTPYFLPDASVRRELVRAVRERNVQVRIVTPGKASDHALTRSSSRRLYGELLRAGIRIFEYQPAMIHAKILIVDDLWSVGGSTNFDHRSFGLNDEINLAVFDPRVARSACGEDFEADLAASREVTLEQWRNRPLLEATPGTARLGSHEGAITVRLRMVTYNIHKCRGMDRRVRPDRILAVLNAIGADVIALQEVLSRPGRSAGNRPGRLPRPPPRHATGHG